jgi:3-dehydroquinate synthase
MVEVKVKGTYADSSILVGESITNIAKHLPASGVFVLTDDKVRSLYGKHFESHPTFTIRQGEGNKTLQTVEQIYRWLLDNDADRSSFILAVGGGIVCDVAGFVASTFMRGVRFGFVSTTLLSQVDASVGGKNGVNLEGFKNIVGCFNQPEFVICDPQMLLTLDERDYRSGLAEVIKHTLIADAAMFAYIEQNADRLLARDAEAINRVVENSVRIKANIVSMDEREKGERRKLNLGHTWGHAVEKLTHLPHGEAVSIGMMFAAQLSAQKGLMSADEVQRLKALLEKLQLPTSASFDRETAFGYMLKDKKKEKSTIHFVLMEGIGSTRVEPLSTAELQDCYKKMEAAL